ncbi:MAG: alpha/beta hydrolase [Pseudomonas piscis]|uniref:alpha/beta hydrolase n=1 Tax=Pseudomonas piscis TaxID=2614538 RepID=UPI003D274512
MPSLRSYLVRPILRRAIYKDSKLSLDRRRIGLDNNTKLFRCAAAVNCEKLVVNGRPAEWITAPNSSSDAAVLYLHGGAYTLGSIQSHRALVTRIVAASQVPALLIDYRLAPEHPFPAALDDAMAAFVWMVEALNISADRIVICGDSAGGGLAITTALELYRINNLSPVALVLLSPWADLTLSGATIEKHKKDIFFPTKHSLQSAALDYAKNTSLTDPRLSPIFADLRKMPSTYIQVGSEEILLNDSLMLVRSAKQLGIDIKIEEWPGMWHVWQAFHGLIPEANEAIMKIGKFIQSTLSRHKPL